MKLREPLTNCSVLQMRQLVSNMPAFGTHPCQFTKVPTKLHHLILMWWTMITICTYIVTGATTSNFQLLSISSLSVCSVKVCVNRQHKFHCHHHNSHDQQHRQILIISTIVIIVNGRPSCWVFPRRLSAICRALFSISRFGVKLFPLPISSSPLSTFVNIRQGIGEQKFSSTHKK